MSQNKEQPDGRENADETQPCCDGGSCCPSGSDGGGKGWKIAVFVLIVVAAGAVLANSFIKKSNAGADQSQQAFASFQMDDKSETPAPSEAEVKVESSVEPKIQTEVPPIADKPENKDKPAESALSLWGPDLDSLASLNNVATDTDAVFVFVSAQGPRNMQPVTEQIEAAVKKIKSDGVRVSVFRLKEAAPEYVQLAEQVSVPCVLAMVKGGGMSTVSGEITEAKLVQAFVTASRPTSGCCPPGSTTCPPQK